jgi:uncharacterized membrane protein
MKKYFLAVPLLFILPIIITYDVVIYFLTKPACLNCGNVIEFLKSASLTIFLLGGIGYKLKKKK